MLIQRRCAGVIYPLIRLLILSLTVTVISVLAGCSSDAGKPAAKMQVVTTLFPLYDFARTIAGDRAEVTMLLPPGVEPHSFEPRPGDILRISRSSLFVYTSPHMEPWAAAILKGIDSRKLQVVNAGQGVTYLNSAAGSGHDGHGHEAGVGTDPHIWLDFANASLMVDNILSGLTAADPANAEFFARNASELKSGLSGLDRRYREGLSGCATKVMLHGGHYTFGYLARRYGLEYSSLSGVSSESEPSASRMAAMVRRVRSSGATYLFAEELLSPRMTEALAAEAGVAVLKLHGAHNLGNDDVRRGVSFIGLMDQNLVNLRKGLKCQQK